MAEIDWAKYVQPEETEQDEENIDWAKYAQPQGPQPTTTALAQDDTAIRDWLKSFYSGKQNVEDIPITPELIERFNRQNKPEPEAPQLSQREMAESMTPLGQLGRGLNNVLQGGTQAGARLADLAVKAYSANPMLAPDRGMGVSVGAKKDDIQKTLGQVIAGSSELEKEKGLSGTAGNIMHQIGAMAIDIPVKYSNPTGMAIMAGEGFAEGSGVSAQDYANQIESGGGNATIEDKKTILDMLGSGAISTANAAALLGLGKFATSLPQGIARPAVESAGMAAISAAQGGDPVAGAVLGAGFGAKKINAPRQPLRKQAIPISVGEQLISRAKRAAELAELQKKSQAEFGEAPKAATTIGQGAANRAPSSPATAQTEAPAPVDMAKPEIAPREALTQEKPVVEKSVEKPVEPKVEITTGKELAKQLPPSRGVEVDPSMPDGASLESGGAGKGVGRNKFVELEKVGEGWKPATFVTQEGDVGVGRVIPDGQKTRPRITLERDPQTNKIVESVFKTEVTDPAMLEAFRMAESGGAEKPAGEISVGETFGEQFKTGKFAQKPADMKAGSAPKRNWNDFPMRYEIDPIREHDVPPEKTESGNLILYHGTSDVSANEITKTNTLKKDDIGHVGVTTTPNEARKFAGFKRKFGTPTVLRLEIDKNWIKNQKISHETGGTGHNEFLIRTESIPPEAIKNIEVYDMKAEQPEDINALKEYAANVGKDKNIVGVKLVGSHVRGGGKDVDIVYDFGDVKIPKDSAAAVAKIEGLIESSDNMNLDLYDTFIKVGDRYFHVQGGAGREVIENTAYGKDQAGKPEVSLFSRAAQPEAVKTELPPGEPPSPLEPPSVRGKRISQTVTNTEAKLYGKKQAKEIAKDFIERDISFRKPQKESAQAEVEARGVESVAQEVLSKDRLDDYDMMRLNVLEPKLFAETKSSEDIRNNPMIHALMKKRVEAAGAAGKELEAQKYIDILEQPQRQAQRQIKESISKNPKLRDKERVAKNLVDKIDKKFYEINKSVLSRFDDNFVLNVSKLLKGQMKIDGVKLREVINKHYTEVDLTGKTLAQKITEQMPLSETEARTVAQYVEDGFSNLTKAAKKKYLDGLLEIKSKKYEREGIDDRIIKLSNRGAMSGEMFADIVAKKIGLPVLTPEHMFELHKQAQKIQEAPNSEAKIDEIGKLYSMLYSDAPKTKYQKMWDIRALGLLANAKTFERNIAGQGADALITNLSKDVLGIAADKWMTNKLTQKLGEPVERTMVKTDWDMMFNKAKQATRFGVADVRKRVDTLKARIEQMTGTKLGKEADKFGLGRQEFKPGGFMDKVQRGVAYGLQVPDRAFQEAVYWESYHNQINALRPEVRRNIPAELKQKISDQAWSEASQITYRKMNKFSEMVVDLQKKTGLIGKILLTFPKVAANIIYTGAYKYSPVGLAKGLYGANKLIKTGGVIGNQRQIAFDIARGGAGTAVMGLGMLLGFLGTAAGGRDADDNVAATERAIGEQPGSLRLFGHSVRVDWVQPVSIMFELGAEIGKALRQNNNPNLLESTVGVLSRAGSAILDEPLFTGVSRAMSAGGKDSAEKAMNAVKSVAISGAASFIPTISGQARQAVDPYQRQLNKRHGQGTVNHLKDFGFAIGALMINKIPFASALLERRKDVFGRDVKYHQSGNFMFDVLDRFINPSLISDLKKEPGIEFILQLNRDKPADMSEKPLPRVTDRTYYFTRDRKRYYLTGREKSEYQGLVGKDVYDFVNDYYENNRGSGMSTEEQVLDIYREISKIGKRYRGQLLDKMIAERGVK